MPADRVSYSSCRAPFVQLHPDIYHMLHTALVHDEVNVFGLHRVKMVVIVDYKKFCELQMMHFAA